MAKDSSAQRSSALSQPDVRESPSVRESRSNDAETSAYSGTYPTQHSAVPSIPAAYADVTPTWTSSSSYLREPNAHESASPQAADAARSFSGTAHRKAPPRFTHVTTDALSVLPALCQPP